MERAHRELRPRLSDRLRGNDADSLSGDDGNDLVLVSGSSSSVLDVRLYGGLGNDQLEIVNSDYGPGFGTLDGGAGDDVLYAGASYASIAIFGGEGNDFTYGDRAYGGNGADTLQVANDGVQYGGAGDDIIYGGFTYPYYYGGEFFGGDGNDLILGGGPDDAYGGNGSDNLSGGDIVGGSGADTFRFRGDGISGEYGSAYRNYSVVADFQAGERISLANAYKVVGYQYNYESFANEAVTAALTRDDITFSRSGGDLFLIAPGHYRGVGYYGYAAGSSMRIAGFFDNGLTSITIDGVVMPVAA